MFFLHLNNSLHNYYYQFITINIIIITIIIIGSILMFYYLDFYCRFSRFLTCCRQMHACIRRTHIARTLQASARARTVEAIANALRMRLFACVCVCVCVCLYMCSYFLHIIHLNISSASQSKCVLSVFCFSRVLVASLKIRQFCCCLIMLVDLNQFYATREFLPIFVAVDN